MVHWLAVVAAVMGVSGDKKTMRLPLVTFLIFMNGYIMAEEKAKNILGTDLQHCCIDEERARW